jgi:hypothetical protein
MHRQKQELDFESVSSKAALAEQGGALGPVQDQRAVRVEGRQFGEQHSKEAAMCACAPSPKEWPVIEGRVLATDDDIRAGINMGQRAPHKSGVPKVQVYDGPYFPPRFLQALSNGLTVIRHS